MQTKIALETTLWRNPDFLKFWAGETVSMYGAQLTTLALPLTAVYVFQATATEVGWLRFVQLAPYLGLALLFGVWVDRWPKRPVLIGVNLVRAVLIGLIPLLAFTGHLTFTLLVVIAGAVGVASVLFDVGWMSYVPTLVRDPKHYVEANAKMGISSSSADVVGPGLAGAIIGALTAPIAVVVNAFSYLVSVICLWLIRVPEERPQQTAERHLLPELREGLKWVFGDRILRPLALIGVFCNFSLVGIWTLFVQYAVTDAGLTAATLGVILSSASIGGLLGAMLAKRIVARFPLGRIYAVSMSAIFLGPLLLLGSGAPIFIASFFVSYFGLGVAGVVMVSLRQSSTPPSLMGRMNAAFRTMLFGGGSLGGPVGGFLAAEGLGLRGALSVFAIASTVVVIGVIVSPVSRLHELPSLNINT